MPLRLLLKSGPRRLIDLSSLSPAWAQASEALPRLRQLPLRAGRETSPLADLFSIEGDPTDGQVEITGDLSLAYGVGAGMSCGSITVEGSVGDLAGAEMRGGLLRIRGNTGDWLARQMRGGRIHVQGSIGDNAAAAPPGAARGITGGELLVEGNADRGLGRGMRRGLIAVRGSAGDDLGADLFAGTILVGGDCGVRPGVAMRRGTLIFLGAAPQLPLTFVRGNRLRPQFMGLLSNHLKQAGLDILVASQPSEFELYHGDMLSTGRGEVLLLR